ncbi:hypothetical protein Droror1_Dr00028251 [Drosera rotundifolia]
MPFGLNSYALEPNKQLQERNALSPNKSVSALVFLLLANSVCVNCFFRHSYFVSWLNMPWTKMRSYSIFESNVSKSESDILNSFWKKLYDEIQAEPPTNVKNKKERTVEYNQEVFNFLMESKGKCLTNSDLEKLQRKVESLTQSFDEPSIYKSSPELFALLISPDKPSIKEYLKSELPDFLQLLSPS